MNITLLTQYFPPEIGAPQTRLGHLAGQFARSGHEVSVLTAMPNYPTGRIYPGYRGCLSRERKDNVDVLRTFIWPAQSAAVLPRLLTYLSFVGSSALLGSVFLKPSDYLLVESPPLFLGLSGVWLSRLKGGRLIFNVSDLWPESALRLGVVRRESGASKAALRLESFCYRHAWLVTGQSRGILENIVERFPGLHTRLLSNGVDTDVFHPVRRSEDARLRLAGNGEFVSLYAGLHGLAQGLDQVLEAARTLQCEGGYRFVFIGDGPKKGDLVSKARLTCGADVAFHDPRPSSEIPPLLASADLVVVPLAKDIPGAVPSKLYEAMASARPIVLIANGEAADIVRRHEAGIVVQPGDIQGLVRAIREFRSDHELACRMAENARKAAVKHFDRTRIAQSFISYLEAQSAAAAAPAESHYEHPVRA